MRRHRTVHRRTASECGLRTLRACVPCSRRRGSRRAGSRAGRRGDRTGSPRAAGPSRSGWSGIGPGSAGRRAASARSGPAGRLSSLMSVTTRLEPIASGSASSSTGTTLTNGNMNSRLASGCSGPSQSMTVGSRYVPSAVVFTRSAPRYCALTSTAPATARSASIIAETRPGTPASANGASSACSSSAARGTTWRQALRQRVGDGFGMAGDPEAGGIHARAAAVVGDRRRDDLDVVLPVVDAVLADDHLAVAGAVHLDA